jgi:hypothetical protein
MISTGWFKYDIFGKFISKLITAYVLHINYYLITKVLVDREPLPLSTHLVPPSSTEGETRLLGWAKPTRTEIPLC